MPNDIEKYLDQLDHAASPELAVIAATAIGRQGRAVREKLERPATVLGSLDAQEAVLALRRALWDMDAPPAKRAAAGWALGEIGGAGPAGALLTRLETAFGKRPKVLGLGDAQGKDAETDDVRAALVEALGRALDAPAGRSLTPNQRGQLNSVWQMLQQALPTVEDPDLSTALALTLAKLAHRVPAAMPHGALSRLLNSPDPAALLAAIAVLSDLIPGVEREAAADSVYEGNPSVKVTEALVKLGEARGRPYTTEEAQHLLQMAAQFWYAEADTQVAVDRLWERMGNAP